jgi:hypothetical protein
MPAESSGCYRRSPQAEESKVGDRSVLYHRVSRKAIVLNPTGATIWQLLASPQTVTALAARLSTQFPSVAEEQAQHDVTAFLQDLSTHDLIVRE